MNESGAYINQFNNTINNWIRFLDHYTLEALQRQPEPSSWSLGQMYIHIILDTKYFVDQVKACLLSDANSNRRMSEEAVTIFRNNAFPDARLQGPSTNVLIPQPQNKKELRAGLIAIREEVNHIFTSVGFTALAGKTEHPGFLFFNALEWLRFAEIHMRHHFRQKKRIEEQLGVSLDL